MPNIIFISQLCRRHSLKIFCCISVVECKRYAKPKANNSSLIRPLGEQKTLVPKKGMELLLLRNKGTREIQLTWEVEAPVPCKCFFWSHRNLLESTEASVLSSYDWILCKFMADFSNSFEITECIYVYMCMHIIVHCYLLMHALASWSMVPVVFSEGVHGCELPNAWRFPCESSTFGNGSSLAMSQWCTESYIHKCLHMLWELQRMGIWMAGESLSQAMDMVPI